MQEPWIGLTKLPRPRRGSFWRMWLQCWAMKTNRNHETGHGMNNAEAMNWFDEGWQVHTELLGSEQGGFSVELWKKNSHETKPRGEYHRQQGSNFWLEMIECHLHVHTESNRLGVSNKFSRQYRLDSVFPNSWGFEIVMSGLSQTNYD